MEALKPEDPTRIGPFTPLARIGAGGMGRVFLARSRGGRPVAVKVIRAEYAEDERFRTRFRREVEAARTVNGLYTASVLDAGPDDEEPWLATAYIPGPSLQRVVQDHGPLPERSARVLGAGIAEALGAIHSAGLIHRDLKPSNVICGPDGPRVIDFGISHAVGGTSLTATGVVVGSPRYASPEQCRADAESSPASDVFALGGVLVYATTGIPPFGEGPDHVQLYLVVHEQPDLAAVPHSLRPIVSGCLEKNAADRPSIDELLDTLLPPDDARAAAVDWLPAAVHREMRNYAAAPSTGSTEVPTHERPEDDPVRSGRTAASRTEGSTHAPSAPTTPVPVASASADPANKGSHPTRRRLLTGFVGLGAMAASGGGAWFASARHSRKNAAQNAGATSPAATPGGQNLATGTAAPSTPATPHTPPSPHATGKYGEDWSSGTDLNRGGGAVIRGNRMFGVYTATSNNPNPQQSLVVLDTETGKSVFDPANISGVDAASGAGIAVDDQYIYTYGSGTVYAWHVEDGRQAWSKGGVLQASNSTNSMPFSGILGMLEGVLIIGAPMIDPQNPPCLAGFDVASQSRLWVHKPAELLTNLPADMTKTDDGISIQATVPRQGGQFYLTISDQTSLRVLKAVDPKSGKDLWHTPFTHRTENDAASPTPTVTGTTDHVYLTDMHSGSIHAYDLGGTWKWTHPDPDAPNHVTVPPQQRYTGPVAQADGVVYATNARSVIALDTSPKTASGATLWAKSKEFNGILGAPVVVGDKIWVEVNTPSNATSLALTVLNRSDGTVVQQYAMPPGPTGSSADMVIADPATPAVYVLTASGAVLGYRREQ
ncbi:protein kinase domain-containing protein [Catenulispora subtropica]|uniref:Protein kinase domain-containing protein n=1 Tax=Catenulispora subtropica TaxID=450798 RepID=A0ABN2RHQ9_9ACTN